MNEDFICSVVLFLDVSKALAKMASNREILKNSKENRAHYFVQNTLVSN